VISLLGQVALPFVGYRVDKLRVVVEQGDVVELILIDTL
jgi:hypothetical protein